MGMKFSKRLLLKGACCGALALTSGLATSFAAETVHEAKPTGLSPDDALAMLKIGNENFVAGKLNHVHMDGQWRQTIAKGQHPFAILVGCSDSRVPPELLFQTGLGDLFIVRVAGNTVDLVGLGSIEYAVEHLGVPLVVVLGHERCGAVSAAVATVKENASYDNAIEAMVAPIVPAVLTSQPMEGDLLDNSVRENVRRVVERLKVSTNVLSEKLESGALKIVGARYDLDEGKVEFIA